MIVECIIKGIILVDRIILKFCGEIVEKICISWYF